MNGVDLKRMQVDLMLRNNHYSFAQVRRVEMGERLPTKEILESFVKAFQLNPNWSFLAKGEDLFTENAHLQADEVSSSAGSSLVQWRKKKKRVYNKRTWRPSQGFPSQTWWKLNSAAGR